MINVNSLPESLDFHLPSSGGSNEHGVQVILVIDDCTLLYRQLVCWTLVQSYWYYVLAKPCVTDTEYDLVCAAIKELEEEGSWLQCQYSPTRMIGCDKKDWYPPYIRWLFREIT